MSNSRLIYVKKRSGVTVPFNQERITNAIYRAAVAVGGRDKIIAENLSNMVVEYLENNCREECAPHIEEIQDAVEKILIENRHAKVAKAFILYREEKAKRRMADSKFAAIASDNVPWQKIWYVLNWAVDHGLETIDKLNERIIKGEFSQIVHESETAYENDILTAADNINERADELKMVFVSGPSSSGKTTTTKKLEERLNAKGLKLVALNVDHYFYDLEMHPKDEFGDYDFETPQALDLEMINEHLVKLCKGEEVKIPFYDFKIGKRYLEHSSLKLAGNEILLIDSLHGLYPQLSKDISSENKFRVYIEPLLQMKGSDGKFIKWTDLRLIRRMLRDSVHRAYNPRQTLEHWHYVRSSEMRNIIPYQSSADYIINSGMPYEIPLYKARIFNEFVNWEKEYKNNPLREDAYERAYRVRNFLESCEALKDDSAVPHNSVLREFIGGSSYKY